MRITEKDELILPDQTILCRFSLDGKITGNATEQFITQLATYSSIDTTTAILLSDLRAGIDSKVVGDDPLELLVEVFPGKVAPAPTSDPKPDYQYNLLLDYKSNGGNNGFLPLPGQLLEAFSKPGQNMRVSLKNVNQVDYSAIAPLTVQYKKRYIDVKA